MKKQNGFTLIEIIVSLFIFSIMAAIATAGLRSVLNTQKETAQAAKRVANIQIAMLIMQRDFVQTIPRAVTDSSNLRKPALFGDSQVITFTHNGFINPDAAFKRSALQRVRYFVRDNKLIRETWWALDQAPTSRGSEQVLFDGVNNIQFQYLGKTGFVKKWPIQSKDLTALPKAVQFKLNVKGWGTISLVIAIPASQLNVVNYKG